MPDNIQDEWDFSFKKLFVPLTTFKAIHWIIFIGIIVYFNMLFNWFVFDDIFYIVKNTDVHSFNLFYFFGKNYFNTSGQYRPLPVVYFAGLYALFNTNTFFYHFPQLLFHIYNTILIFLFFKTFVGKKISLFLSFIFLVHPMNVESVSYISAVASPLSFAFGMSALLLSQKKQISPKRSCLIFGLLLCSLLTKETGALFILIILFYRFLLNRSQLIALFSFSTITTIIYLFIRLGLANVDFTNTGLTFPTAKLSLFERILNQPAIILYYLKTFFFPANLAIHQQWVITQFTINTFYIPLLIVIVGFSLLLFFGLSLYKKSQRTFLEFIFFLLWFLLGLILSLQIFQLDSIVADRWFYFPMVGLLGLLGIILQKMKIIHKLPGFLIIILAVGLIVILAVRTMVRNTDWHDEMTLYTHDAQIENENNWYLEANLGGLYYQSNNYIEASKYFKKAAALNPDELNLLNLGMIYEKLGKIKDAKELYMRAAQQFPSTIDNYHIYERLISLLILNNDPQSAEKFLKESLNLYPNQSHLWALEAINEYNLHNQRESLTAADVAKTLDDSESTEYVYTHILQKQPISLTKDNSVLEWITNP